MVDQQDTDQEEAPECEHDYRAEYDGEPPWSSYRGDYCIHCGQPRPDGED